MLKHQLVRQVQWVTPYADPKDLLFIVLRTHTGHKPFQCPLCQFDCARKDNLQKHIKVTVTLWIGGCYASAKQKGFLCTGFPKKAARLLKYFESIFSLILTSYHHR